MEHVDHGTAIVTGASSDIGPAAVAALAHDWWRVVATVRHPDSADAFQGGVDG